MMMPGRYKEYDWSRTGSQSQQKDDEVYGKGNLYAYKYRMNDARINRFFSPDPLHGQYPHNSDYAFSENRLIDGVELEGFEFRKAPGIYSVKGMYTGGAEIKRPSDKMIIQLQAQNLPEYYKKMGVKNIEDLETQVSDTQSDLETLDPPDQPTTTPLAGKEGVVGMIIKEVVKHSPQVPHGLRLEHHHRPLQKPYL